MLADVPQHLPLPQIPRAELPVRVGALSPSVAQPPGSAFCWTHPADELLACLRGRDELAEGLEGRVGQTYSEEEAASSGGAHCTHSLHLPRGMHPECSALLPFSKAQHSQTVCPSPSWMLSEKGSWRLHVVTPGP